MADNLQRLLNYIVENRVMQNESREAQLDATAVQDVRSEIAAITEDQRADAARLAPHFARGLRMAAAGPITVEDTDPGGNMIAEAFARYLVAQDLATSQSSPISETQYRYTFEVNWPTIRQIAQRAGIDLDAALADRE
jgi:hypothetical protein